MKPIRNFENYSINKEGIVITLNERGTGSEIKPYISNVGYKCVRLYKNKKYYTKSIHRLIAENFIPNPNNKPCVNHVDGNKLNNDLSNLEWCTYAENNQHALDSGLREPTKGVKNGQSKLTKENVLTIRSCYHLGFSQRKMAKAWGVSKSTIQAILERRTWRHI